MHRIIKTSLFILLVSCFLFWVFPASAQQTNNFLDPILGQYADNAARWESPLQRFAMQIFWMLALIEMVWVGMDLILNKGDFGDWGLALLKQMVVIGFFYSLLTHSSEWAIAAIQSFRLAGDAANGAVGGTSGIQPSDIFDSGANIATSLIKSLRIDKPVDTLALVFSALLILISFALIAALQIVALVESYIFTYAGILFLGFGGCQFTRNFAVRYLIGLASVGTKLFIIQLIIGLAVVTIHQWEALIQADQSLLNIGLLMRMVGGAIVYLAMVKLIPDFAQGVINSVAYGTSRPIMNATIAAGQTGMAALSGIGAVGTGVLGAAAGWLGMGGAASGLGSMSNHMGNAAAHHSSEAFRQGTDSDVSISQFMPKRYGTAQNRPPVPFRRVGEETYLESDNNSNNSIGGGGSQ